MCVRKNVVGRLESIAIISLYASISLNIQTISASKKELQDAILSGNEFKYITTELITTYTQQENELVRYLDNNETYLVGNPSTPSFVSTVDYENSLFRTKWLGKGYRSKIPDNQQRFYGYLFQSGLLKFNEHNFPISRLYAKEDIFKKITREFHIYSDDLKEHLTNQDGNLYLTIARRDIQEVTYQNEYESGPIKYYAFTYTYKIRPLLNKLNQYFNKTEQLYLGKTKLFQDPDDGIWKIVSHEIEDNGEYTLFDNLSSRDLNSELKTREKLAVDSNQVEREEHYKSMKYYVFEFGGGQRDSSYDFEYYLGLFTPDDYIKISSLTKFSKQIRIKGYNMSMHGVFDYKKYKKLSSNVKPGNDFNSVKDRYILDLIDWHYGKTTRTGFHLTSSSPISYDLKWLNSKEREIFYAENYFFEYRESNASRTDGNKFKIEVWCSEQKKLIDLPSCDERFSTQFVNKIDSENKIGHYPQASQVATTNFHGNAIEISVDTIEIKSNSVEVNLIFKNLKNKNGVLLLGTGKESKHRSKFDRPYLIDDDGNYYSPNSPLLKGDIENYFYNDNAYGASASNKYKIPPNKITKGAFVFQKFQDGSSSADIVIPMLNGWQREIRFENLQLENLSANLQKEQQQESLKNVTNIKENGESNKQEIISKVKKKPALCDSKSKSSSINFNFVKQTDKSNFVDTIGIIAGEFLVLTDESLELGLENSELELLDKYLLVSIGDIEKGETIHQEKINGVFIYEPPEDLSKIGIIIGGVTGQMERDWADAQKISLEIGQCKNFNLVASEQFISRINTVKKDQNKQKQDKQEKAEEERKRKQVEIEAKLAEEQARQQATSKFAQYIGPIRTKVTNAWIRPGSYKSGTRAKILVRVSPQGDVLTAKIQDGSGDPIFDRSAINAIYKASPLPMPDDQRLYPHYDEFIFKFDPPG